MAKKYNVNSAEANLIWKIMERNYPDELRAIHFMQYQDMQEHGSIQKATDDKLNELLEKVVQDNKRLGRT